MSFQHPKRHKQNGSADGEILGRIFFDRSFILQRDLTSEQCLNLIRRLSDCGIRSVGFTGGESLVRWDLPELFRACSGHDIRVTALLTDFRGTDPDARAFVKKCRFHWIWDVVEKAGGRYALK